MTKERPILFSAPMIRAILDGRKGQTRRVVKPQPVLPEGCDFQMPGPRSAAAMVVRRNPHKCDSPAYEAGPDTRWFPDSAIRCPYGVPGDRLWVRESWYYDLPPHKLPSTKPDGFNPDDLYFRADGECCQQIPECSCAEVGKPKWRPGMFLPRWASRLTLLVNSVRVERLHDISERDAKAEGTTVYDGGVCYRDGYSALWDRINGPGSWAANPWVWVVGFERIA